MTIENTLLLVLPSLMTMHTISSNSREFNLAAMEVPPAEKIFPFESPIPTSYESFVVMFCLNLTVFE
jgi:hypothetical protein